MTTSWWSGLPTSPPLDVEAGVRYLQRQGRVLDVVFVRACQLAGVGTTSRQARKWNNGKGLALRFLNKAKDLP